MLGAVVVCAVLWFTGASRPQPKLVHIVGTVSSDYPWFLPAVLKVANANEKGAAIAFNINEPGAKEHTALRLRAQGTAMATDQFFSEGGIIVFPMRMMPDGKTQMDSKAIFLKPPSRPRF